MIYTAFDPGKTTGVASVDVESRTIMQEGEIRAEDAHWMIPGYVRTWAAHPGDVVIIENFRQRPGSVATILKDDTPLKIIGMIEVACKEHECEIVKQEPAVRIRIDDTILVDVGFDLTIIKSKHVRDALRHIVRYWRKQDDDFHQELIEKEARRLKL